MEHQEYHHAACIKSSTFPECDCGNQPAPAPVPHPTTSSDTCLVATIAYKKANQSLNGRGNIAVWNSLDEWMGISKCPNVQPPEGTSLVTWTSAHASTSTSMTYFVSPTGSDNNSGTTQDKPFGTLQKAQQELRSLSPSQRAGMLFSDFLCPLRRYKSFVISDCRIEFDVKCIHKC